MPIRNCCVSTCKCNVRNCILKDFPKNKNLNDIWLNLCQPHCQSLNVKNLRFNKICVHHFEPQYLRDEQRKQLSCPTLFSEKEISDKVPNTPMRLSLIDEKTYSLSSRTSLKKPLDTSTEQKHIKSLNKINHDHCYMEKTKIELVSAVTSMCSQLDIDTQTPDTSTARTDTRTSGSIAVTLAKTKRKSLRDTHREKLKKINKTKSGQSQKNIKPSKCMSHMEFLLPYTTNTERDTNVPPHPDITTSLEEIASAENSDPLVETDAERKTDNIIHDDGDILFKFLREINDNRENRAKQRDELRKELLNKSEDALKAFFDSMYESTKQMPELYQRSITRNLFQLVMDAEENIANTNYTYYGYSVNSLPSTNQTNYSSGDAFIYTSGSSGSNLQKIEIGENTTRSRDREIQDPMPAILITTSGCYSLLY